jgi:REP element-mobilizing transposase RayT
MPYDPEKHRRRSIRLQTYDYARPGGYFVTICTQDWKCLFGTVVDEEMRLNPAGEMIQRVWHTLPGLFSNVHLDAFVVMPNHVHGIVILIESKTTDTNPTVGAPLVGAPDVDNATDRAGTRPAPTNSDTASLGDVVGAFKSITTNGYIDGVKHRGWMPFARRLWQRNYWEHVIRVGNEGDRIRRYIDENPARWQEDRLYLG